MAEYAFSDARRNIHSLEIGDEVVIKNAYIKRGFGGQTEISTKVTSFIIVLPSPEK